MDDLIRESMDGFQDVWRRVTARPGPAEETPDPDQPHTCRDPLPALIREEARAAFESGALARMLQGDGRALLTRHAAEGNRRLRRLRAEYFIATGRTSREDGRHPMPAGKLDCLRELYLRTCGLADGYEQAAGRTGDPVLRELYSAFADDSRRRAKELRALLIASF